MISRPVKLHVYKTIVRAAVMYANELWLMTKQMEDNCVKLHVYKTIVRAAVMYANELWLMTKQMEDNWESKDGKRGRRGKNAEIQRRFGSPAITE
ncbi:hypothetical protein QE152_g30527 [Popillia japonica]|uniref:Uncharacterized protein n=1 Tax=Popillia japonica TaxID=7064 RepID=A0AAW1JE52_POPJA